MSIRRGNRPITRIAIRLSERGGVLALG